MKSLRILLLLLSLIVINFNLLAQEYVTLSGLSYRVESDNEYARERCRLDVYYPSDMSDYPTVVWFHGGGLSGGEKYIPEELKQSGMAVVAVNYRLMPNVSLTECIDDAAAAVAWAFNNIAKYGGTADKIFVAGHSAGGYLTNMVGLDKKWLEKYGIDANCIAGLIPFSGHAISHFAYRASKGMKSTQPSIDEFAPLYYVRKDAPPLIIISGDREMEMLGRYEENAYLWRMMKVNGHEDCYIYELDGHDHGRMERPGYHIMKMHIDRILNSRNN